MSSKFVIKYAKRVVRKRITVSEHAHTHTQMKKRYKGQLGLKICTNSHSEANAGTIARI